MTQSRGRLLALVVVLAFSGLWGCQTPPTKVTETRERDVRVLMNNARNPIKIDANTVVVDVRSSFEYAVTHVPGSYHLQWQDFAPGHESSGRLTSDLQDATRRLALYGIAPGKKVVVVGQGLNGGGAAGRMAWTLYYLGVSDVQTVALSYFNKQLTNVESPAPRNVNRWRARPEESVLATREEVMAAVARPLKKIRFIDVRSRQEYFQKQGLGEGYNTPDLQALNIEWKEFYTDKGRPNLNLRRKLEGVGVSANDRIIVLSNRGVRSAAATMSLLAMGFGNAANFADGLQSLSSGRR